MRSQVRFSRDTNTIELRCEFCAMRGDAAWWPIAPVEEARMYWNMTNGFTRCKSCWALRDRDRLRSLRLDPTFRERDRAYQRTAYADLSLPERRAAWARKRAYHREWMRAYRAKKKEAAA